MTADVAGLRKQRKARSTGTLVGLYDGEAAGMDTTGGRWQTVCEEHGWIISHETYSLARHHMPAPEQWCEMCMANTDDVCGHAFADTTCTREPGHIGRHSDTIRTGTTTYEEETD